MTGEQTRFFAVFQETSLISQVLLESTVPKSQTVPIKTASPVQPLVPRMLLSHGMKTSVSTRTAHPDTPPTPPPAAHTVRPLFRATRGDKRGWKIEWRTGGENGGQWQLWTCELRKEELRLMQGDRNVFSAFARFLCLSASLFPPKIQQSTYKIVKVPPSGAAVRRETSRFKLDVRLHLYSGAQTFICTGSHVHAPEGAGCKQERRLFELPSKCKSRPSAVFPAMKRGLVAAWHTLSGLWRWLWEMLLLLPLLGFLN